MQHQLNKKARVAARSGRALAGRSPSSIHPVQTAVQDNSRRASYPALTSSSSLLNAGPGGVGYRDLLEPDDFIRQVDVKHVTDIVVCTAA